jgi:hypothetical protein
MANELPADTNGIGQHNKQRGWNMVKSFCNVDAIVEQLLNLLGTNDDGSWPSMIHENGQEISMVAKSFRRLRGRIKIIGHCGQYCNWRFSEKIISEIDKRIRLS